MADAGRGGWMGGSGNGRVVSPWAAPDPEPRRSNVRMKFEPEGPSSNRQDMINRIKRSGTNIGNAVKEFYTQPGREATRNRRISYGVGGGVGALATILGLSNNKEKEEQYQ